MSKGGKRYRSDLEGFEQEGSYALEEAVQKVKDFKPAKFKQSVDLCINLGIDAKQADQAVRGSVSLPHGIGVSRRVIAFCTEEKLQDAKDAGAVEAGGEELVKKIQDGWLEFDVAVASPDMMRVVSRLGKVLGPKGLMPSPKSGSVTPNVVEAVKEFAAGKVEFRNDAGGNIHAVVGKADFDDKMLTENAQSFIDTILRMKPAATKGVYVKKIFLSLSMSPSVRVAI